MNKQLSICDVYIQVESQEQADRLKQVCIDYRLPIWDSFSAWKYDEDYSYLFSYDEQDLEFFVFLGYTWIKEYKKIKVTEPEFMQLLKETKL